MSRVALGFRAHSGWAAVAAVAGSPRSPAVVERRRVKLADPSLDGSKQPYHTAEGLELEEAERIVKRCADGAKALARRALRALIDDLRRQGHEVVACGLLLGSGRSASTLAATLASHALIHTADGELFRDALADASRQLDLPVTRVREKELLARGASELGVSAEELLRRLGELGKTLGPPWRQDEKYAALAAWLALPARR